MFAKCKVQPVVPFCRVVFASSEADCCKFPPVLRRPWLEIGGSICTQQVWIGQRPACRAQIMSRPESPEPCYDHPECIPIMEAPVLVSPPTFPWMVPVLVPVPVAPLVPDLAPQEIGLFLRFHGMRPQQALAEELQAFLGWVLELLILSPESTGQLRAQLRRWQCSLRLSTAGCRLSWTEAFVLYGLRF